METGGTNGEGEETQSGTDEEGEETLGETDREGEEEKGPSKLPEVHSGIYANYRGSFFDITHTIDLILVGMWVGFQ